MNHNLKQIATDCMESDDKGVQGWHRLAGDRAQRAKRTTSTIARAFHRMEEARSLLEAVQIHSPDLSTADMLAVAACIAERADV